MYSHDILRCKTPIYFNEQPSSVSPFDCHWHWILFPISHDIHFHWPLSDHCCRLVSRWWETSTLRRQRSSQPWRIWTGSGGTCLRSRGTRDCVWGRRPSKSSLTRPWKTLRPSWLRWSGQCPRMTSARTWGPSETYSRNTRWVRCLSTSSAAF